MTYWVWLIAAGVFFLLFLLFALILWLCSYTPPERGPSKEIRA
jgi:hypothetical protein